jgi:oligopeptidase A
MPSPLVKTKLGIACSDTMIIYFVCLGKSHLMNRIPVAYLVCNQSPPDKNTPSLMTFREVETLFHEVTYLQESKTVVIVYQ